MQGFMDYMRMCGKSENTIRGYCDKFRIYMEWCEESFGSRPERLYRENILDYTSYMKNSKRYHPKSVNNHLSALRCYNEYLVEGQVYGIGCKIFTIAGPVILYGIFTSWVLGFIYWIGKMLGVA